ncbi:hypothetical protein OSTOST_18693 [Ostertagia ostertagi]
MTFLLPSIAEYSVPALTQQFEYFFFSICLFFGADGSETVEPLVRIEAVLRIFNRTYNKRVKLLSGNTKSVILVVPGNSTLVYDSVASRVLKYPVLIAAVSNTKWDVNELQSRHSNYVDFMVKDFEGFALRLERATESIHLSEAGRALLWDRTIYYAFKALVQGYCEGGKCSTEGRALMQLDFQHLLLKLEPICGLRPVPHTAFVEGYIKAFYLPENGLEEWISKHTEYTAKQMISLLSVATHVSKKARTRIINALND